MKFSGDVWKSAEGLEADDKLITQRQKMLGDLVENHLVDKNREGIIQMLGVPSAKMDPDGDGPALSYVTGYERDSYIRIDSEWLIIYFDDQNRFTRYTIAKD